MQTLGDPGTGSSCRGTDVTVPAAFFQLSFVDHDQTPHAQQSQLLHDVGSQAAHAHHRDAGRSQAVLPFLPKDRIFRSYRSVSIIALRKRRKSP